MLLYCILLSTLFRFNTGHNSTLVLITPEDRFGLLRQLSATNLGHILRLFEKHQIEKLIGYYYTLNFPLCKPYCIYSTAATIIKSQMNRKKARNYKIASDR